MNFLDAKIGVFLALMVLGISCLGSCEKHKRQIYREQVLPALGGKIPEEAFRTDRLALNRLNKDGIAVIDGVLLEARDHDKNPDSVRSKPEVIKVYVTQDSRYVPPEGRYNNEHPKSVDTTYVLRKPVGHDGNEPQRLNGIGNAPVHRHHHHRQQNPNNYNNNNNNNNNIHHNNAHQGYGKTAEVPNQGLSPPKAHGFANFHRFAPYGQPSNHHQNNQQQQQQQQQQQPHHPTIYKPIITPLVIPARGTYFRKSFQPNLQHHSYNQPSWDASFDWRSIYRPREPIFLEDGGDFFDSHQIITDYEGFLNTFHGRSYRHVGSPKAAENDEKFPKDSREQLRSPNTFSDQGRAASVVGDKSERANLSPVSRNASPAYTSLTSIPTTGFSCDGRKGTFADVQTKCQVFHECSGWSKTSSLCPAGTAYSAVKKRCEWWNTVTCGSH